MTPLPGPPGPDERPLPGPDERLRRLLGGDDLEWLVRRVRDRLEAGRALTGAVTLPGATAAQRQAVSRLTGRSARPGASLSVSLTDVDRILRSSGAAPGGLAEAVTRLTGPVRDLAAERRDLARAWTEAFAPLDAAIDALVDALAAVDVDAPVAADAVDALAAGDVAVDVDGRALVAAARREALRSWRSWLDSTGLVRRLAPAPAEAGPLLAQVAEVLRRLPSSGIPLGRLAAECCGDAHALDDGRPVGTLALSAARALAGLPFAADPGAGSRRAAWAAVGVHLDELSSTVLCLGLPGVPGSSLGTVLGACREAGQPASLTLRQLRCHTGSLPVHGLVRICENPVVVAAAADELGDQCGPLVCVGGQPSAAVWRLLELLAAGGAEFTYHGDFDWGGVRIAETIRRHFAWQPWRYDRAAYEDALSRAGVSRAGGPGGRLTGKPAPTPWDPALAEAMRHHATRVEEELTLDTLLL